MNKRISDEKLCILSNRKSRDMYYLSPEEFDNLVNDLKDAREALKKYAQKPSLTEHLQKLANKHKVCFTKRDGALMTFFSNSKCSISATGFFGFDINDYNDDFYAPSIICERD